MQVEICETQLKIFEAIAIISNQRECDKKHYINASSIAKHSNLTWKTVKKYLKKGIIKL